MHPTAKLSFRVTWRAEKQFFTFDVYAHDMFGALKKAHRHLKRVGLSYYTIDTITQVTRDIPF